MSVPPGWGLTLTFSSYPWRLTKIAFTPENFHKIWVFPRRRIYVYLWRIWVYPWRTWVYPWRISLLLNWGGGGGGCGYYMHYPIWNGPLPSRPLSSTRPFLGRQATALPAFCCGEERCMRTQKTAGFALETIRTLQNTNWLSCLLSICLFSSWLRITKVSLDLISVTICCTFLRVKCRV